MKLNDIKPNDKNPRYIKDERFKKLCQSIDEFPKMMAIRPIIIDENNIILGGNMRYRAIKAAGMKEIPNEWVRKESDLTQDEKQRFIIADNVGFGEWDEDILKNEWDAEFLEAIGKKKQDGYFQRQLEIENEPMQSLPYPITIVLDENDYDKWQKLKQQYNEQKDLKLFIKLLKKIEL